MRRAAAAWCASTSRWTASGSAGPASRTPAPSRAHAAEPSASPSPATSRAGRSARTASSPPRRTWRPAPAAGASARSTAGPRTGRSAPAVPPSPSWPARSAGRRAVRDLPGNREAMVPGLPAPAGRSARPAADTRRSPPAPWTAPLCAGCTPPPPWAGCPVCSDPDHPSPGRCARCIINARLTELMGPDDGSLPPGLQALRREIAAAEHAITATRWAAKPSVAPVLSGLADGSIPLTHQALDELPRRPALDLPAPHPRRRRRAARPRRGDDQARGVPHDLLDAQPDPERRRLLHRYLIWHLVRRMRSRNNGKPATRQQVLLTRRLARGAVTFLDWLDSAGLTLESLPAGRPRPVARQRPGRLPGRSRRLIRWANAARLTSCYLPAAARWTGPASVLDGEDRWDTARRLLHDDTLKPEDRLAGLLVLLYAQGVTAISRMTAGQVQARDDGTVRLQIGRVPVQLPEPVILDRPRRRGQPQRPRHHRGRRTVTLAVPRRPARPADQRRETHPAAGRARDQPPPGPQHRTVPARRRGPRRHPRPHPRHQHHRRRHLAAPVRRRLGRLRRRRQPPLPQHFTSHETTPADDPSPAPMPPDQAFRQFQ